MKEAFKTAEENKNKKRTTHKRQKDLKATLEPLEVGGRPLVRNLIERWGAGKIRTFWEHKIYRIKEKKDKDGLVYAAVEEDNPKSRMRVLRRNHLLSCEQLPAFTVGKSDRKQQQQQQQKQQHHCNKETVETWNSSNDSDADLSQFVPAIHTHHQKMSQGVIKKQQQQERSLEQSLPPRKYITRRSQTSKIIKVQAGLPSGRKIEGRPHIQKVISVQHLDNLNQLQRADQMIGGDWKVERQTTDSSNMEVGNGMGKTDQCEDNGKLGNNNPNQQKKFNLRLMKVNGMVGNSN